MSQEEQQIPLEAVQIPTPAYADVANKYKRNNTSQINLVQTNEPQPETEEPEAQENPVQEEIVVNPESAPTEAQADGQNLSEIEKEILILKEIVMKLQENYEKAVSDNEQLRNNFQINLQENEEYVELKENYAKSVARIAELEELLITEKMNNMVAVSNEKVAEIKNSEKVIEIKDAAQGESENVEEVHLVACSAPRQPIQEDAEGVKVAENTETPAGLNIELIIAQNELRLLKAEIEELKEQNKKLQTLVEKQAIGLPSKTELEEKIALLEKEFEEQKTNGAELALLLEAEEAKVTELTEKLEAFEAEKLKKEEEPALVAYGLSPKESEVQTAQLAELERQIKEQLQLNEKLESEKAQLAKQLEEAQKTEVKITTVVQAPTQSVETRYHESTIAPATKEISATVNYADAQRALYSSNTNANYVYESANSNYNKGNNASSSTSFVRKPSTYASNKDISGSSASASASASAATSYNYAGASSYAGSSGYSGSNYYYQSSGTGNSSGIPLVSSSNATVSTSYKSPNPLSKSIISVANNYTTSTSDNTNNYKNIYSSSTPSNNNTYYSSYASPNNYASSYTGASNSNGDLVLSASSNPNKTTGQVSYSTYSGSASASSYPSVSYSKGVSQNKTGEDLNIRISQETDDIVARVLRESNISLGSSGLRSQQSQNISSGATLVSSGAPVRANKSLYASTYYVSGERSNETENIVKNKSVYEYLVTK